MTTRTHIIRLVVATMLLSAGSLFSPVPFSGPGHADATSLTDTNVEAAIPAALAQVSPGLCLPGDTPLCSNSKQDQVHIYSQACSAVGTFEGTKLAPNTPFAIYLTAFMDPSVGFATPNCLTTHTHTSDKATAFGKPVNAVTIGGVSRSPGSSFPFAVAVSRTATGWMDGPDCDHNPVGDHRLVFSIQVRLFEGSPPVCITQPFTGGDVTALMSVSN